MKGPCDECGSSDARHTYPDGHSWCFGMGCPAPFGGSGGPAPAHRAAVAQKGLLNVHVEALGARSIDQETAEKFGAGYGELDGRRCQVYTYRTQSGKVIAQKLRFKGKEFTILGNGSKLPLFGQHLWKEGRGGLTITEGELDAMSVAQAQGNKWAAVSVPNGASSAADAVRRNLEWIEEFERVVFMFDMDEPGQAAARECAALLTPGKAFIAKLDGAKDANELLMAGKSKAIVDAYFQARQWRPDGVVSVDDVYQRAVLQDWTSGVPVPHVGVQQKLRGLQPGEITVLLAGTGAGKSTMIREWATALAIGGHRIGYIGLEEGVVRTLVGLLSVLVSRPLHLEDEPNLETPDVREALGKLRENVVLYDAFGSLDPDLLLNKMRFMAVGERCKVIFLDHLSIVTSGTDGDSNERRDLDRLMTKLAGFVTATRCHVVAIAHLSRREGTPHEEGRRITLADVRGTHGIAQLAYNVVAIERDQQADGEDQNLSTIRILKNRFAGRLGVAGYVRYDERTGRQVEEVSQFQENPLPSVTAQGMMEVL